MLVPTDMAQHRGFCSNSMSQKDPIHMTFYASRNAATAMIVMIASGVPQAQAADLGKPAPAQNAYAADGRASIWTGAYFGLGLGGGVAMGELKSAASGEKNKLRRDDGEASVTLFGGYNWQSGPWVYGIEADVGSTTGKAKLSNAALGDVTAQVQTFGSLQLRAGYAINNWLLYNTIGLAVGEAKITVPGFSDVKVSRTGLALGLGVEYDLNEKWRLRAEALTYLYGSNDLQVAGSTQKATFNSSLIRLGAAYKF